MRAILGLVVFVDIAVSFGGSWLVKPTWRSRATATSRLGWAAVSQKEEHLAHALRRRARLELVREVLYGVFVPGTPNAYSDIPCEE